MSRALIVLIACLAAAGPALASSDSLDEYLLAATHDLPPVAKEALQRVGDPPRQLLALRGYVRAGQQLTARWSWSAQEIRAYETSDEYRELLTAIEAVRDRFEAQNPGYSLYANTTARSFDLQLQRWNSNRSVGVIAGRLQQAALRELSADAYPAHPDAKATVRFTNFLREWRPTPAAAPLAVPGLSQHGRSRAIDFQIVQNGRIIAPTEVAKVRSVWEERGWTRKLATAMRGAHFAGPLQSPNEPWHYEYVPRAARGSNER
ncbi:MAG TPA: hypothetical protein VJS12_05760 [Steroidobacteraceae bacterium]|nr:hypothetical protein [Steroidobacteraceae bacterium]